MCSFKRCVLVVLAHRVGVGTDTDTDTDNNLNLCFNAFYTQECGTGEACVSLQIAT